ncbi:MAG: Fe-S cluster assembly protein SufD [Chitinophagales bacterium]|nr:Fe-S cluster assembly protein SufD [Bacteroidota bacterium]
MITQTHSLVEQLSSGFNTFFINSQLADRQKAAFSFFEENGFPHKKMEDWQYLPLAGLLSLPYEMLPKSNYDQLNLTDYYVPFDNAEVLVFVNGYFQAQLSTVQNMRDISSWKDNDFQNNPYFQQYWGKFAEAEKDGFVAANLAFAQDGAFIALPDNTQENTRIYLLHLYDNSIGNFNQQHNLIVLGENTHSEIIEAHYNISNQHICLSNVVNEIFVEKNAHCNYYKLQDLQSNSSQINSTNFYQKAHSYCNSYTLSLNGKLLRNNLNITLSEEGAEHHLMGFYFPNEKQLFDNHTTVNHAAPNCFSNEIYKGFAADKATAIFNGKIWVEKYAQKTNAFQSNKNILLNDGAQIFTKPQLEIFADDVKCSHGCTIGQLDAEAMFYLQSRGIGETTAQAMLMASFAAEVFENMDNKDLYDFFLQKVYRKLHYTPETLEV